MGEGQLALNYGPSYARIRTTLKECIDRGIKGVICLDCALGYHGLSTFMYNDFPCYYVESKTMAGNFISSAISYFFVENVDYSETIFIDNGVYVTSPERTICDMILYDRHEYHLLESIDDVYNTNQQVVNIEKLESMVDACGIRERFDELKAESEDIWDY